MELAPKGTGKSFVLKNISSKIALLCGKSDTISAFFDNGKTKKNWAY